MSDVKRYELHFAADSMLKVDEAGRFVLASDYDALRAEVERLRNRRIMIPTGEVLDALEELRAFTLEHDSGRAGVLRGKIDAILRSRE